MDVYDVTYIISVLAAFGERLWLLLLLLPTKDGPMHMHTSGTGSSRRYNIQPNNLSRNFCISPWRNQRFGCTTHTALHCYHFHQNAANERIQANQTHQLQLYAIRFKFALAFANKAVEEEKNRRNLYSIGRAGMKRMW